jgi:hypothetical protein
MTTARDPIAWEVVGQHQYRAAVGGRTADIRWSAKLREYVLALRVGADGEEWMEDSLSDCIHLAEEFLAEPRAQLTRRHPIGAAAAREATHG